MFANEMELMVREEKKKAKGKGEEVKMKEAQINWYKLPKLSAN